MVIVTAAHRYLSPGGGLPRGLPRLSIL